MRQSVRTLSVSLLFVVGALSLPQFSVGLGRFDTQLLGQETVRPRGETVANEVPGFAAPASLIDSLRAQIDPYQPRRLQSLLLKPEVQAALSIDRNAYRLVAEALSSTMKRQLEVSKELGEAIKSRDAATMRARMETFQAIQSERENATAEALTEVFPPQSFERLKQIAVQIQIREAGLGDVLVHGILAEKLNFSDAQRETLATRAQELEQEKQAKIQQLIAEYDAKLLAYLTPSQRQAFERQIGEPFEYTPVSREAESFRRFKELSQQAETRAAE